MRPATAAAVAATSILGVGAAAVAAGRYASDAALGAPSPRPFPADRRLTVHATAAGQITLTRSFSALRPGTYGLAGRGVHAVVGPVIEQVPGHSVISPDTVVRRLERVTLGSLKPGTRVRLTPSSTGVTRWPPSGSRTRRSRSPANSAPCRPGSCPPPATPG